MKKALFVIVAAFALLSFTQPKTLKVELSLEQWQAVAEVIENSNSPHQQVKAVQGWVIPQLTAQLDTTKKK